MSDFTPSPSPSSFDVTVVQTYPEVFVVQRRPERPYWLHILLLLLTVFTTLVVGAHLQFNFAHDLSPFNADGSVMPFFPIEWIWQAPQRLLLGIPFAVSLMAILLAHEMGHFVYCEKNHVDATLPFFIPAPTLIGTLGAFIRIKSPIRSRQALFDIGIAGPIAGFIVAIPVLVLGLALSRPLVAAPSDTSVAIGFPLIFHLVHRALLPFSRHAAPLNQLSLHPVAIAAWVGMFATALNLLPGGQLDGGHIIYAAAPQAHKWITRLSILVLLPLAYFCWIGWVVWAAVLGITGWRHPRISTWPGLNGGRRWLVLVALLLLVLTFTYSPLQLDGMR
jgi:membrane-associated protease RseP (regulator of RpoE activity)